MFAKRSREVAKGLPTADASHPNHPMAGAPGAQFEFAPINVVPTVRRKKIEDLRVVDANPCDLHARRLDVIA